jgi:threonine dehydrogenase-like Zn-dependent dehydrogenase
VQALLRHSDVKTTLQLYAHSVSEDRTTAEGIMLQAILGAGTGESGLRGNQGRPFRGVPEPKITKPTDAFIRLAATCVCGSDLWSYHGISPVNQPTPMGHEYCGIVEEVGSAVKTVRLGQFVIGSFFASDNTCPHCNFGYQSSREQREFVGGAQAPLLRVPLADGTLVPTPGVPAKEMIPNLLATSNVLRAGWFAADAANVRPGMTIAVVGDRAVGVLAVLSARQMGADGSSP